MLIVLSIEIYFLFALAEDLTYYFSSIIAIIASIGYIFGVILSFILNVKTEKENNKL